MYFLLIRKLEKEDSLKSGNQSPANLIFSAGILGLTQKELQLTLVESFSDRQKLKEIPGDVLKIVFYIKKSLDEKGILGKDDFKEMPLKNLEMRRSFLLNKIAQAGFTDDTFKLLHMILAHDENEGNFQDLVELFLIIQQQKATLEEQNQKIEKLNQSDYLTGIYNRVFFETRLREEIKRSERHKTPLSVLMFDIDFFKHINDTYGHPMGDEILKFLSLNVKQNLRQEDVLARYGGDEFMIILPETNLTNAILVAENLRKIIKELTFCYFDKEKAESIDLKIRLSLGVAELNPAGQDSFKTLLQEVDMALYNAKETGRDRVCATPNLIEEKALIENNFKLFEGEISLKKLKSALRLEIRHNTDFVLIALSPTDSDFTQVELKQLAQIIQHSFRENDCMARTDENTFTVLLKNTKNQNAIASFIQRLNNKLKAEGIEKKLKFGASSLTESKEVDFLMNVALLSLKDL